MTITPEDAEKIAANAIIRAFTAMGMDTANPLETQQDMAFLRKTRHRADNISNRVFTWIFILMVTGGSLASWKEAIADAFRGN